MAQADYIISNQTFPNTRADINSTLQAIATTNSGTSAPSTQYAGQFWIDTTSSTWTLYIHDGSDDIQFATIDTSANTVNFIDSELGDNSVTTSKIADANVTSAKLSYPLTTFSSTGIDDNATSTAITINSSQQVGIGTASPTSKLQVEGSTTINSTGTPPLTIHHTDGNIVALAFKNDASDNHSLMFTDGDFRINYDGSEKMRIDSSGNVGIGTSSPEGKLHIQGDNVGTPSTDADDLVIEKTVDTGLSILSTTTGRIFFGDASDNNVGAIMYVHTDDSMRFSNNASESMRIDSSGRLLIGNTTYNNTVKGVLLNGQSGRGFFTVSGDAPVNVNRLTNDGRLVEFMQDSILEGTIDVSGSTVSYNGFTGTHWSRFQDNSTPTILKGTVLETLDEICDWYNLKFDVTTQDEDDNDIITPQKIPYVLVDGQSDGDVITYNHEGTDVQATIVKEDDIKHMKAKVSDTVDAKNVYGVFSAYDNDGEGYNDFYVASVGSFVVRIKQGETIAKGDLLQSNGDGTAKVQTDDAVRSSSFAKVLSTTIIETYEDGSYLVPCSLMC